MDIINYVQGQIFYEKVIIDFTWFLISLFFDTSIRILHMKSATLSAHFVNFPLMLLFSHKKHTNAYEMNETWSFVIERYCFGSTNVIRNILKDILWIWVLVLMII